MSDKDWAPFEATQKEQEAAGAGRATLSQVQYIQDLALETGHDPLEAARDLVGWEVQDLRALSQDEVSEVLAWLKTERSRGQGWRRGW